MKEKHRKDNLIMYNYFKTLNIPFKSGRVNMWSEDNIYNFIPSFKFKFTDLPLDDIVYINLKNAVNSFKGKVEWEMINREGTSNYIIKPVSPSTLEDEISRNRKFIKDSIDEIPFLIKHLVKYVSPDVP